VLYLPNLLSHPNTLFTPKEKKKIRSSTCTNMYNSLVSTFRCLWFYRVWRNSWRVLFVSQVKNYAGGVLRLRTRRFPIESTYFCRPGTGLGRSISPQPRRFRPCPPGIPTNVSRQIFWY